MNYEEITWENYRAATSIPWGTIEKERIQMFLSQNPGTIHIGGSTIHKVFLNNAEIAFQIFLIKDNDDYYFVNIIPNNQNNNSYYRCDQLDGLEQLFNEVLFQQNL